MRNLFRTNKFDNAAFLSRLFGQCLIISVFCLSLITGVFAQGDFNNSENQELDAETLQMLKTSKSFRKDFVHHLEMESGRQTNPGMITPNFLNSENLSGDTTGNGLDPAFANVTLGDGYTRVEKVAVQPDGKILVGGTFPLVNGTRRFGLARLNANGTLDTTFNAGNIGPNGSVDEIVIQADGKILIGGFFTSYNGISRNRIARLNSDGTLDMSFDPGAGANSFIYDIIVLPNNKILAAGSFIQFNNTVANRIVRLNSDGTQDNTFTPALPNTNINQMAVQADGRILIGGNFNTVDGLPRNGIARLNADGTHDTTFDPTTNTTTATRSVAIQPDGKILVGAAYGGVNQTLVRLNSNGSLDGTFTSTYPVNVSSSVHDMSIQPDGKILAAGFYSTSTNGNETLDGYGVVRFNADGSNDPSFLRQLMTTESVSGVEIFSIAQTPGGQIVAVGDTYKYSASTVSKHIAFLNNDGTVDNNYSVLIEGDGRVETTARQSDGKIVVAGSFLKVNGVNQESLARLNADGTLDTAFIPVVTSEIFSLAIQSDDKILVGGRFPPIRLNANGSVDNTFVLPADVGAIFIFSILVQPDNKILFGGGIINPRAPNGQTGLYRVNSDGSEDTGFNLDFTNRYTYDIALLSDGRIYIGGSFPNFAGSGIARIARLNSNGTLDATFNPGTGANSTVRSIAVQPDGKVLASGFFTTINGQYARGIARLNSDGSFDPAFTPGTGVNGALYNITLQPDNKILIGGSFLTYDGAARTNLARLNTDGTLDNSFTDQTNGTVFNIGFQPDGKAIIGGTFTSVNGVPRGGLARLTDADLTPPVNDNFVNAAVITGLSGNLNTRNVNATAEAGEPAHAGVPAARSVWFKWRAPEDGLFSFTTVGSSFDTTLALYTGTAVNALTAIASNDDNAPFDLTGRVVFRAFANTDYYIAVDGKNNESGIVNLIWKQAARSYRFYAQTGNGNVSPRIPVITAVRNTDGAQYLAQNIAAGVFELDLPVDNAVYTVSIGGTDQWSPNSFVLNNSSVTASGGEENGVVASPSDTGITFVTTAVTVAATVIGELTGVSSMNGVTVFRGSEGGPNPIAPIECPLSVTQTGIVAYSCQFIVDTRHQIKPTLSSAVFTPGNRPYEPLSSSPLPGPDTAFTRAAGTTYNIGGQITANGVNLPGAVVKLTGRKVNSYITSADGTFQFNNLPAGGDYTVTTSLAGYTFAPQMISNLQGDINLTIAALSSCQYTISSAGTTIGAGSGTGSFEVNTSNGCPWAVNNSASWITINIGSGNGTSRVYFTAQPNNGAPRSAAITVGGQVFTVTQADGCTYSFSAASQSFPASGGSGSFTVTPSGGGCVWQPVPSDYCMLSVSGGGTGNGAVNFTVGVNEGVARSASIRVGSQTFTINQEAAPGMHRTRFDFDDDGRADIAVYRPDTGVWYILQSATQGVRIEQFGITGDIPQAADYDGDGKADLAIFRPNGATGAEWWYRQSSNGAIFAVQFGDSTDKPVPADYTGDGKTDIAFYRPSTGQWFVLRSEDSSYYAFEFGLPGDIPAPGDYDGDGKWDAAVYRPSTGTWYVVKSGNGQVDTIRFGQNGDIPTAADFDGDGKADISVYRPSNNVWYRINSRTGQPVSYLFGANGDVPVVADYNGDKQADIAVYRPSTGFWLIMSCTVNSQFSGTQFGLPTDIPVTVRTTP